MQGFVKSRTLRVLGVLAVCQMLSACVVVPAHQYRRAYVQPYDAYSGPPARDYRDPRYRDYRDHRDYRDYRDRRDWDGRR